MSHFKAKMHEIRFRLGLRRRLRWESLQRSPRPLAGFKGPTSKGREKGEGERGGEKAGEKGGKGGSGIEGEGRERMVKGGRGGKRKGEG